MNLYGPPSCTLDAFAAHLAALHDPETGNASPARSEARAIWDVLTAHRVDPAVALGFFHHESKCGTRGRALATRSWGNLRWRPVYAALPYPVVDVAGFVGYPSYTLGARHFAEHLLGQDGTDFYRGLVTVAQVVPKWAPAADGNVPAAYIAAVESLARALGGIMPKVAVVAGHVGCENITADGLRPERDVALLRTMTGTAGERAYTGDFAARLAQSLERAGVQARAIDSTYDRGTYVDWKPDGVIALHYHRDRDSGGAPHGRAMFAAPDAGFGFQSADARAASLALVARIVAGYTAATTIPTTQEFLTIGMRQLYTWDYLPVGAWAVCAELGHADVDAAALYNSVDRITPFLSASIVSMFAIVPPPPPGDSRERIAVDLEAIARRVRALP